MPRDGGRGGNAKKSSKPVAPQEPDDNVVFSNNPKAKKKVNAKEADTKQDAKTNQAPGEEPVKKPDTRTLIGGASWTGKLPVNLLSEHCQKQRWGKPEYTMHKTPDGFSSMAILRTTNPKTKETITLPNFKLPPSHVHLAIAPTAAEARNFAATYALFRVCSMRNLHMMLPPRYKDLWRDEFQELKKDDVAEGKGWMYEADPFATKLERDEAQALKEKKRLEREKQKAQEAAGPVLVSLGGTTSANGTAHQGHNQHKIMRGWTKVPKIEMGKKIRGQVEDLIRKNALWNHHGIRLAGIQRKNIIEEFAELGFRRSHVEEAADECGDRGEVLEWLLIHVPEDDLPQWSLPENYTAGLSMASKNLKREAAVKRLTRSGYSTELCEKYFDARQGDEDAAAQALQDVLMNNDEILDEARDVSALSVEDANADEATWFEEKDTLEAIYGERFRCIATNIYEVQLHIEQNTSSFILHVRKSKFYPSQPPIVAIFAPATPSYIRLSIIRQALEHIQANLLGEPIVFSLVDWLEMSIPKIIDNPGKLRDVASVVSGEQDLKERQNRAQNRPKRKINPIDWNGNNPRNVQMYNQWLARQNNPRQVKMLAARQSLPAWGLRDKVVNTINANQVTIISGETGSGKSTQSVQFVLDDMIQHGFGAFANLICTQPRRISALGLADRVSEERCSPVGEEVGYIIRGESRQKPGLTKITFVTTGVLLRRLQTSGGSKQDVVNSLADVSHVFVDEVHERSLDTDFLLILLKDVLAQRKDLKVILMSATLDATVFEKYFSATSTVGHVEIEGRTYPVEDRYLDDVLRMTRFDTAPRNYSSRDDSEDNAENGSEMTIAAAIQNVGMKINYDLIAATVRAIDTQLKDKEGGILIFLPGTMEINKTLAAVQSLPNTHALPLHASLTPAEQRRVFPPAPKGKRKVIAATNVAETSITIEDIVAVIDAGRVKETSFDPQNNMVRLEEVWASRAACKQRRGRAGRVSAGICYKLYTRNAESKMAERPDPEIRRVPLEQLCLSVRAMGIIEVSAFLASALTPPSTLAVEGSLALLARMGVLDPNNSLTALGHHLAMIPADLRCGKLLIYGTTFGCTEATLILASILTTRSPFLFPPAKRAEADAARKSFAPNQGDLIADLRAYETWSSLPHYETRAWCSANFLASQTLHDIASTKSQYLTHLTDAGFLPPNYSLHNPSTSALNAHNSNTALLRALIAGAFNPHLATISLPEKKFAASHSGAVELDPEARTIKYYNQENGRVFVHPSSTLFSTQSFPGSSVYLSYFHKMATSKVFVRELTPFCAYAALLFGGRVELDTLGRGLVVDGWLRMRGWARIGVLVGRLRGMLDRMLEGRVEEPGRGGGEEVVGVVRRLVEFDGLDC